MTKAPVTRRFCRSETLDEGIGETLVPNPATWPMTADEADVIAERQDFTPVGAR